MPTVSKAQVKAILGRHEPHLGGGVSAAGGVMGGAPAPPPHAARLPRNWRNVLGRVSWFASPHIAGTNMTRACITLDGTQAIAGSLGGGGAAVCVPFDFGGLPLPVMLPSEITWHKIPGQDGAVIWEDEGAYRIQTDSGTRVYATRETASLDPYPWSRFLDRVGSLDGGDPEFVRWNVWTTPWKKGLAYAPSDVLELHFSHSEAFLGEVRNVASPWPLSPPLALELSQNDDDAPPDPRAKEFRACFSAEHLRLAFGVVQSESCSLAARTPEDGLFIFGLDGARVLIAPVAVSSVPSFSLEEEVTAPDRPTPVLPPRATMHESLRLMGGASGAR